jgi:hypothetical protein
MAPISFMYIRVLQDTLIGGRWTGIGVGNFDPVTAQHLLDIGVAEPYEAKITGPDEFKKKADLPLSASQQGQASPEPTVKKRRGRKPKSSL